MENYVIFEKQIFLLNYCPSEGYLYFYLSWTNQLIKTKMLECLMRLLYKVQMWRKLRLQLKSANEGMVFHQEREKKSTGKKALFKKVRMVAKKLKQEHYSLSGKNNLQLFKKTTKKTVSCKLQITNIDAWKHLAQLSCMSNVFGLIIF